MELMDLNTMKLIVNLAGEVDPSIIVYGEPWRGGDTPLVNGTHRGAQRDQEFAILMMLFVMFFVGITLQHRALLMVIRTTPI